MWPYWFGRPVCVLFLTDCEMTFGKVIGIDGPGDYRGSLRLSLTPGYTSLSLPRHVNFLLMICGWGMGWGWNFDLLQELSLDK